MARLAFAVYVFRQIKPYECTGSISHLVLVQIQPLVPKAQPEIFHGAPGQFRVRQRCQRATSCCQAAGWWAPAMEPPLPPRSAQVRPVQQSQSLAQTAAARGCTCKKSSLKPAASRGAKPSLCPNILCLVFSFLEARRKIWKWEQQYRPSCHAALVSGNMSLRLRSLWGVQWCQYQRLISIGNTVLKHADCSGGVAFDNLYFLTKTFEV